MTAKNVSLLFLGVSSPLMCLAFFVGGPAMEILFALLSAVWPVALIALGVDRRGGLGPLRWVLLALLGLLVASVAGLLAARGGVLDDPWILGLPLATAIEVYGILLLPLPLISFAYAWTFDRFGLAEDELAELRERFGGKA